MHLYILNNATTDKRLLRFCDSICQAEGGLHIVKDTQVSYATAKNELLSAVKEPYVCFFPANLLLDDYWLDELHYIYDNVSDAGILSIRSKSERVELSAYVFGMKTGEDKMENAWFTENNSVEGLMFFSYDIVEKVGVYDCELGAKGFEDDDYSFRVSAIGKKNFYIMKQFACPIEVHSDVIFPKKTIEGLKNFKANIEQMFKTKEYTKQWTAVIK